MTYDHKGDATARDASLDPITFEVIRHRLWAINDEQAVMAARLSGSSIVYEAYDFNAALVTPDGRGLYTGVYILHHGATIDEFVRYVLADEVSDDLAAGDMFFTNDPWWGALHANDGILVMPITWEGQVVAWSGIVMHDEDVGSPVPGSRVAGATDRFGEAPLLPAIKIVEGFEVRPDIERAYLRNSRTPELNALNMRARVAALTRTHDRVHELIEQYGLAAFLAAQDGIVDHVETVVRKRLSELPDGVWRAQTYHDHDGTTDEVYPLRCTVTKRKDRLTIDMTGTARQAPGPINCARPAMEGAALGVVLTFLCYDLPWSIGALRQVVDIVSEEGTVTNAVSPAAVSMASIMGTLSTQDLVGSAVGKMLLASEEYASEAQATWQPGSTGTFFSAVGVDGEYAIGRFVDPFGGGGGARTFTDGVDSGGVMHSMASRISNVETLESRAPVLQIYRRESCDTGGAGRFRGGVAIEFAAMPHKIAEPGLAITRASGVAMPGGRGLSGGLPGNAVSNVVLRNSDVYAVFRSGRIPASPADLACEEVHVQQAKQLTTMGEHDVVVGVQAGGAGFGDPLRRDPELVVRDVRDGLVSADFARTLYGVVVRAGALDPEATQHIRDEARRERLTTGQRLAPDDEAAPVDDGTVLHPLGDTVEAVANDEGRHLRCTECHFRFGDYTDDYKMGTSVRDLPLVAASPANNLCNGTDFVLREFSCPGCGTAVAVDVQRREEPVLAETTLSLDPDERSWRDHPDE